MEHYFSFMSYYIWQQLYQRSLHNAQNAAGAQPDRFEKRGFVKHLALAALVQKVVLALSTNTAGRKTNRWQKKDASLKRDQQKACRHVRAFGCPCSVHAHMLTRSAFSILRPEGPSMTC